MRLHLGAEVILAGGVGDGESGRGQRRNGEESVGEVHGGDINATMVVLSLDRLD